MLGKNRLSRIEGLEALPKLDVLDLHCNRIRTIEGLSHLAELVRLKGSVASSPDPDH